MSQRQSPGTEKDHISKSNSKDRVRPCILSLSNQLAEIKAQWETPFFKSQTSYKNTTYIIHYFTQLEPYSLKVGVKLRVRVPSPNFCMHPPLSFWAEKKGNSKMVRIMYRSYVCVFFRSNFLGLLHSRDENLIHKHR